MEVNEVRRGGRVVSATAAIPTGKKGEKLTPNTSARADRLALSQQVVGYLEERSRQLMEEARRRETKDSGDGKLDLLEKGLKTLNKCQKIYARVVNGDKVPPEDLHYLEKNDPEGFKLALAMRRPNKHPKEWKSVLDDDDREQLASDGESPIAAARPESPAL